MKSCSYKRRLSRVTHTVIALCGVLAATATLANEPLTIGDVVAPRGSKLTGNITVPAGSDDAATVIPVTVINGAKDGPVLSLIAGIHGSEYSPILAMQKLPNLLDAGTMSGAVVIVHIANVPAFRGRTVYFGPDDLKNLNRSFPGDASGSVTERIADALTRHVIKQSDYLMDIHSGDANESLRPPYAAYYAEAGGQDVIQKSERMAIAFGLDTIVRFRGDVDSPAKAIYTGTQAVSLGIPAMDVESGELGIIDDRFITPIVDGTLSVMRDLDMIPGKARPTDSPLFISNRHRVYSDHDGIWYLDERIEAGQFVVEGAKLGVITDYHGKHLTDVLAPASGVLLIVFGTPPVNKDDPLAVIGDVSDAGN